MELKIKWEKTDFDNLVKHTTVQCPLCKRVLLSYYESGPSVQVASDNDCEHFYIFTWTRAAETEWKEKFEEDQRKAKYLLETNNGLLMILPRGK